MTDLGTTHNILLLDFLKQVLGLANDPARAKAAVCEQLRQLAAARMVLVVDETDGDTEPRFIIQPQHRRDQVTAAMVTAFRRFMRPFPQPHFWQRSSGATDAEMTSHDVGNCLSMPLVAADKAMGTVLIFDCSLTDNLPSIKETLEMLSGALGLILRNAKSHREAEKMVEERTQELRVSGERLKLAASAGEIGIWDWDIVNNVLIWDESMYRLYGIREKDFGGAYEAWSQALHPEDRYSTEAEIQAALHGEREYTPEFRIVRPDGTVRHLQAASKTYRDASGRPVRMIGTNIDISERKRNEAVIAARLHLAQFAVTHSMDELLEETLNEVEKLTGSLIGFYHLVDADQKSLTLHAWSTRTKAHFCTAAGAGSHYDIAQAGVWVDCIAQRRPVIHNDYASLPHRKGMPAGHAQVIRELVIPVLRGERINAILGIGNKPNDYTEKDIEIVSLLADFSWEIAERKRSEEALRFKNTLLATQQEAAIDGILVVDEHGAMISFNRRFTEMWAIPPDVVAAQSDAVALQSVLDRLVAPEEFRGKAQHLYAHRTETSRDEILLKDGRIFDRYSAPMCGDDGTYYGRVWYFRDITEDKQKEEQIKEQLDELRRWQEATLGREDRVQEIKREVNELCRRLGEPVRYPSQEAGAADSGETGA